MAVLCLFCEKVIQDNYYPLTLKDYAKGVLSYKQITKIKKPYVYSLTHQPKKIQQALCYFALEAYFTVAAGIFYYFILKMSTYT